MKTSFITPKFVNFLQKFRMKLFDLNLDSSNMANTESSQTIEFFPKLKLISKIWLICLIFFDNHSSTEKRQNVWIPNGHPS